MSGGVLATANRRRRSTVRRVERGVWAGREAEAQVGAVDQETHALRAEMEGFTWGARQLAQVEKRSDAATEQLTAYSIRRRQLHSALRRAPSSCR